MHTITKRPKARSQPQLPSSQISTQKSCPRACKHPACATHELNRLRAETIGVAGILTDLDARIQEIQLEISRVRLQVESKAKVTAAATARK